MKEYKYQPKEGKHTAVSLINVYTQFPQPFAFFNCRVLIMKQGTFKQITIKKKTSPLNKTLNIIFYLALPIVILTLVSCSKATPVPVSECGTVVSHVKKVLKDNAPTKSKMLKQCKAATDEARGCVMAADKPMKILQCDF